MIIRLSNDMQKKVGLRLSEAAAPSSDFLQDWTLHLFLCRGRQFIIITNSISLFSTVLAGKGIQSGKTLVRELFPVLVQVHEAMGLGSASAKLKGVDANQVTFSKVGNRALTGSMNDIILYARSIMEEEPVSLEDIAQTIDQNILRFTNYRPAVEVHRSLLGE